MASGKSQPADTTSTPSNNNAPNAFSGATSRSAATNAISRARNPIATTMPRLSGRAVGRTTCASARFGSVRQFTG